MGKSIEVYIIAKVINLKFEDFDKILAIYDTIQEIFSRKIIF